MSQRFPFPRAVPFLCVLAFSCTLSPAAERVPWTTSHIHGTPEPPPPYVVERMFPALTFSHPLDIKVLPGTDRLVVLQETGQMFSFVAKEGVEKAEPFADLTTVDPEMSRSYALTFHPRFAENRFIYTWLNFDLHGAANVKNGTRIVRYKVTEENPPRIDFSTAKTIITWPAGGHNGGNLRFGPDGMLYITTGDGSRPDPPDGHVTGQDISDLFSSVLRLDVD
ncbi:MAG TPA: PQQ-dependent sugar dehydrogenase, partial [Chthoniobacteraceae bacterium]|nr:PQQ-dependent sugar dehydrogenase [Chthoniobacteraceae bacterium]